MAEYFGGIDPGINGGLTLLSLKDSDLYTIPMPDKHELKDILENWLEEFGTIKHIYIEFSQPFFRDSKKGAFTNGHHNGTLEMLMICMQIPYTLIRPQEWQKEMLKGTKKTEDTKKRALEVIRRLYPKQTFIGSLRSKIPHDGMIDSTLIATLCRRQQAFLKQESNDK